MYKTDKIRAHREALKHAWFNFDHSNTPEVYKIEVIMDKYPAREGQAIVKITTDSNNSYSLILRKNTYKKSQNDFQGKGHRFR